MNAQRSITARGLTLALVLGLAACSGGTAPTPQVESTQVVAGQTTYLTPPQEILDILDAAPPPGVSVSPNHEWLLLTESLSMPTIEQLAQPVLGLAGSRINPRNNGSASPPRIIGLTLESVADGSERPVELPADARLSGTSWSPDGNHVSFVQVQNDRLTQWVLEVETATARALTDAPLNGTGFLPCRWLPGSDGMLCQFIPEGRGAAPQRSEVPVGPTVLEASGPAGPVRTYQNLLQDETDEAFYDYYFTSQLAIVGLDGSVETIGGPAIYASASPSPDGAHLLVTRRTRPYSYLLTAGSFPQEIEVWSTDGTVEKHVASVPLVDNVPIGGVRTGYRSIGWMPGADAVLLFAEALDGGDPYADADYRDRVLTWEAPFDGEPEELLRTEFRYGGMTWMPDGSMALVSTSDRETRLSRTLVFTPGSADEMRVLWERRSRDRYGHPGNPRTTSTERGERVLELSAAGELFLSGQGASPEGDRPFLDRFNLETGAAERVFQTDVNAYETVVAILDDTGNRLLTRRETQTEPPNYYVRDETEAPRALTDYQDPAPQLAGITKQLVTYDRGDGVTLSGTLILPPDYQEGQRLPMVMWIYPSEFTSADVASQVSGSPHRFTRPRGSSHLFLLTQGYAILDGPTLPVIGPGETANDTYIEQTAMGAKAAIDAMVELGVADPNRVGVGGHSYGAFATAHLLAATDLFQAGISRSGAYNRTLTPFGFQSERRTVWENPELYMYISPFLHAHEINEPILMFHGQADTNSGTFPIQSDRMYHAIKGHGGTVTLVKYEHEGHGYGARESVLDCVARMVEFFDRHVKGTDS